MADGSTANYSFVLPQVGAAATTWGTSINGNFSSIDNLIKTNSNNIAAVQGQLTPNAVTISRTASANGALWFNYGAPKNTPRWIIYEDAGTESGGNAASNLNIQCYSDTGAVLGNVASFIRSTQRLTINNAPANANDVTHKSYVDSQDSSTYNNAVAYTNNAAPVGSIVMWPTATPPANWSWCLGQSLPTASYPTLFNLIGYSYGGSGANFNLPNLGGRMPYCYTGSPNIGAVGGEATHTLSVSEMPAHDHGYSQTPHGHGVSDPGHTHTLNGSVTGAAGAGAAAGSGATLVGGSTNSATTNIAIQPVNANINFTGQGGNAAHNNMPPYFVIGFIIRCL
jgi:microcystin-dependent protein